MKNKKSKMTAEEPLSVAHLTRLAEQGVPEAQRILGAKYEKGDGVPKDSAEAMKWTRKAAEQGDAGAQFFLSAMLMHDFGRNVPRSPAEAAEGQRRAATEAAKWHRLAAEQGHTDAQFNLGLLLHAGYGGDKDLVEALAWMTVAAILLVGSGKEKEITRVDAHIGRYETEMSPEQVARAKTLADEQIRKLIARMGKAVCQPT